MVQQDDGSFFLDLTAEESPSWKPTQEHAGGPGVERRAEAVADGTPWWSPVFAESVEVAKRLVESGRVRIQKTVATTDQVVNDSLLHEHVDVERVPIHQIIDGPVGNRQEGDTPGRPVLKEVLVVEKRLMLVEEVRITRRRTEQPFAQTVPVRTETVVVDAKT